MGAGGLANFSFDLPQKSVYNTTAASNYKCDILVVGGSFGGCAAALAAAKLGKNVIITEETSWIGGQATTQGVPTDEHPWIEKFGRTLSYAGFRQGVRDYYRNYYPLSTAARADPFLNPGACWVSALGFEPRVGMAVLDQMLMPHYTAGRVKVLTNVRPVSVDMNGDRCRGVIVKSDLTGQNIAIEASYILDATELGDVLPLAQMEFVTGSESQSETGEPSAMEGPPQPDRIQPFTHLIAIDYLPGEDHVIEKPASYEKWRGSFKNLTGVDDGGPLENRMRRLFAEGSEGVYKQSIWNFRRAFCKSNFAPGAFASDITMLMNGNSYSHGNLIGGSEEEAKLHFEQARQKSLSLLYFLQTEVPSGYNNKPGFPGLRPRGDVFGTSDGLAQYPYVRESRRIKAEFTVLEQHFRTDLHPDGPVKYPDSVGVGGYRVDIHLKAKNKNSSYTQALHGMHWPQQIPLGALIPVRVDNIIPACKNLGVTQVTNGAFRLHPVEWNIGEAAGALAAFCLDKNATPRQVRKTDGLLREFQGVITKMGFELEWPTMEYARSYNSHYVNEPDWYWGEADLIYSDDSYLK
ncbi:FAD dependent oxidoreductase [Anseongella ginsenosidimutans]|uniref:FAD dependent oxidoreductase n=1 Tax=Anseongella ginsenosidimutans TaxID=496056 RepID=A0A4R3KN76_9SPHI|nr:FAD-dependent oxidoreductase [Anseongella ginsenosidimutans]QEC52371.1 FAD-dependent oxidoreductase [Anseongella ginsenosidimutans]TCS85887.1 FAD dependent oxidoreductase [Anseongella ginsenosidimutans]